MKKYYIAIAVLLLISISFVYTKMFISIDMNEMKTDSEIIDDSEDSLEKDILGSYFLENHIKHLKKQSFMINLEHYGDISFLSCLPDYANGAKDKEDVTFFLADNETMYRFPSIYTDNLSPFWAEGVSYVSFADINIGGLTDVIIGVNYITGIGDEGMTPFTMARIFYCKGKEFVYDGELSDRINYDNTGKSIESVLDYIGK